MINNLDILYTVTGQSLVFDAPEGQPSSVTSSEVFENTDGDDATAESATTGSATIDAVDTTFDADSGTSQRNANQLQLAATTSIRKGGRYIATTADGESEIVEIGIITSGQSVQSRFPLANDYASADTFKGLRISHAIDATWVATKNNISAPCPAPRYRWRLQYVVDSVTYVHSVFFDLVRESGTTTVTGLDVDAAYPWLDWINKLPVHDKEDKGDRIIAEAYRQVKLKLAGVGKADEAARNAEMMEDLVIHKAAELVAGSDIDARETILANFDTSWNNFILTPALDFDADGSGAAVESEAVPMWRR